MDDEGIEKLAAEIRRERVERSRAMSFEQKFLAGPALFDAACEVASAGIRHQMPGIGDVELTIELRKRLERRRNRELRARGLA